MPKPEATLTLDMIRAVLASLPPDPVRPYRGKVTLRLTDYAPADTLYALDVTMPWSAWPNEKPFVVVAHPLAWAAFRKQMSTAPFTSDVSLAEAFYAHARNVAEVKRTQPDPPTPEGA